MSIGAKETAIETWESSANTERPHAKVPHQRSLEQTRPNTGRVLRILRRTKTIPELSPIEIREAAKRPDRSGRLLVAALLHHARVAQRPSNEISDVRPWGHDLQSYLDIEVANAQRKTSAKAIPYTRQAEGFRRLLLAVNAFGDAFDAQYSPAGVPNRAAIGELYDTTDALQNPLLHAIPSAKSFPEKDPRANAVIHADRLWRFILLQTQPTIPEPRPNSV